MDFMELWLIICIYIINVWKSKNNFIVKIWEELIEKREELDLVIWKGKWNKNWIYFSIFGDSFNECLNSLEMVLKRCEETRLVINWEKYHFMVIEKIVLRHKISHIGLEVDSTKMDVVSKLNCHRLQIFNYCGAFWDMQDSMEDLSNDSPKSPRC